MLLVFLKCHDVLDGDTIIVRTALCLIMTNDNIQVDVCSIYCLIATIHVAAVEMMPSPSWFVRIRRITVRGRLEFPPIRPIDMCMSSAAA